MTRILLSCVLIATLLSLAQAIPAFIPAKSERSGYGLAPIRRSTVRRNSEDIARAQLIFQQRVAAKAKEVASKYPVEYLSNVSDYSMWEEFQDTGKLPEPIRGKTGSSSLGPENEALNRQNPDTFAPPSTDHGTIPQAKWPYSLSHQKLQNGGWARQQNVAVLPVATEMAGVNMRLEEGAYREMHWHSDAEWSYVLSGTIRVSVVNEDGQNEVSTLGPGDLWYFPAGQPHVLQAISKGGSEFLLVFDSGSFSEDSTLLLSDFIAHIPREVVGKNFPGLSNSDFDKAPGSELYIFPAAAPADDDEQQVESPAGKMTDPLTFKFSEVKPKQLNGGTVKIVDSTTFKASKTIAAAEVTIEPGAMRELHWHFVDEWSFFIEGHARMTVFSGQSNARTFDFGPGDVGSLKKNNGHYIENIGNTTVRYLEVFRTSKYSDVSLSNWLALTPPAVVKDHLGFSDAAIEKLQKFKEKKHQIVPGKNNNKNRKRDLDSDETRMVAGKRSWS